MIDPVTAVSVGSAAVNAGVALAKNFDNFLSLLTAQLRNQDPLSPIDSTDFTQQLVQFTGVEQSIATNRNLERLLGHFEANQAASLVGYIGKTVEANGQTTAFANGSARWSYELPRNSAATVVTITDLAGRKVFEALGEKTQGTHGFVWDGRDRSGNTVPEGFYTMSVSALDAVGNPVQASTRINGTVTGLEQADGQSFLLIGDLRVRLADIRLVNETANQP